MSIIELTTELEKSDDISVLPNETVVESLSDLDQIDYTDHKYEQNDYFFLRNQIDWYIESIKNHSLLDHATTVELVTKALSGDLISRNKIISHNLRLVLSIANRYKYIINETSAIEFKDLVQEGVKGLHLAIEKFDVSLGNKLSTYATWWIHQSISRSLNDLYLTVRLPVHIHEQLSKYRKVTNRLETQLGRLPNVDEIAEAMNFTHEQVFLLDEIYCRRYLSLDEPAFNGEDDGDSSLADLIADTGVVMPYITANRKILKEKIRKRLKVNLTIRQFEIIDLRFGLTDEKPLTLEEVGKRFLITRERIRQIQEIAFEALKTDPVIRQLAGEVLNKEFPKVAWLPIGTEGSTTTKEQKVPSSSSWYDVEIKPQSINVREKKIVVKVSKKSPLVSEVVKIIEKFYRFNDNTLYKETEDLNVLLVQRITLYILWYYYKLDLNEISLNFGSRDHGRIMTACNRVKVALLKDEKLQNDVQFILKEIKTESDSIPLLTLKL